MKDVSIILPSIRPQNLERFYSSAINACKKNSFEVVVVSPYELPNALQKVSNVKYVRSFASPTVASQVGTMLCNSKFLYNTTDDGLIQEGAIDDAVDTFNSLASQTPESEAQKIIVNMIYEEGVLHPDTLEPLESHNSFHPPEYWLAHYHGPLRLPGIRSDWAMCMHFFMLTEYYYYMGGYDCRFEYSNHAIHDLMFRCQAFGSQVVPLSRTAYKCSHLPERTGDHGPIHDAQTGPDTQLFNSIYGKQFAAQERFRLSYRNWKSQPDVWTRRFKDTL
jgi:glycosyltransferase involved in cell wall biosynthesis